MSVLFWRQEQWHHSGGDNPAVLVGLMVALGNLCPQGRAFFLPAPLLHSVHPGLHYNGGPKSLNCRAKAGATEERRSWGAGGCVHPSSAQSCQHLHSQVTPAFCGVHGGVSSPWEGCGRHQTGVRDGLQGHAFAAWSPVTFPFPSSLWKLQCGGVVTMCCWVSVLIFTLFCGLSLTDLFGTFW